jgi:hypothetical protein
MKVLISDNLSPRGVEILKTAGFEVDFRSKTPVEEIEQIIGDFDALIIRSATKVTAALLEKATKLKVIGRAGSGLDNVDIPAATKKGVVVMNTPGGNTVTTAEHTIGMLFACARLIAIGGVVASRCAALGMKVLAYDPFISVEKAKALGVELADLPTIWKRADFITVHTPKTKETANLINTATIAQMKDGVRIINCARGGIVNEQDLYEALKSEPPAADPGQLHRHAAPGRIHAGGPGKRRHRGGRTDRGLPRRGHRPQRGQRTLRPAGPAADARAVYQPCRKNRPVPGAALRWRVDRGAGGVQRRGRVAQARADHACGAQGAADADPRGECQLRQRAADREEPGHRGQGVDVFGKRRVHEPADHPDQGRRTGALRCRWRPSPRETCSC